jgi:hypothetical protein
MFFFRACAFRLRKIGTLNFIFQEFDLAGLFVLHLPFVS